MTRRMDSKTRREALRSFLKECRARAAPEKFGLAVSRRRRVPGLRREEVAELAGISLAWYTRLETAQDIRVSPRLLDRLASVFHLSEEDKLQLFSLAIDELPTVPRGTPAAMGAQGREYAALMDFVRRTRAASSLKELADLTVDILFDLERPIENAYFVKADLAERTFYFLDQRVGPHSEPAPTTTYEFASVFDANKVLEEADLCIDNDLASKHHLIFGPRAKALGAGRFISKGLHAGVVDCAIGHFQSSGEPYSEHTVALVSLIAEILHLALASRY